MTHTELQVCEENWLHWVQGNMFEKLSYEHDKIGTISVDIWNALEIYQIKVCMSEMNSICYRFMS